MTRNDSLTTARWPARPGRWRRPRTVAAVGGAAIGCWFLSGFYTVAPNETGVVMHFGRAVSTVPPGMHYAWPWPIDRVLTPSTTDVRRITVGRSGVANQPEVGNQRDAQSRASWDTRGPETLALRSADSPQNDALTGDENILRVAMVVQYRIVDPRQYLFAAERPDEIVRQAVESALNECIARRLVDEVLTTAKREVEDAAVASAQQRLDAYHSGVAVLGGSLQDVSPPAAVAEAFNDVASAKKDSERLKDEAHQYAEMTVRQLAGEAQAAVSKAEAGQSTRVEGARGEAARFLSLLAEYHQAKGVTRTRLYIEALERVFSSAHLVILDAGQHGGKSNVTIVRPEGE